MTLWNPSEERIIFKSSAFNEMFGSDEGYISRWHTEGIKGKLFECKGDIFRRERDKQISPQEKVEPDLCAFDITYEIDFKKHEPFAHAIYKSFFEQYPRKITRKITLLERVKIYFEDEPSYSKWLRVSEPEKQMLTMDELLENKPPIWPLSLMGVLDYSDYFKRFYLDARTARILRQKLRGRRILSVRDVTEFLRLCEEYEKLTGDSLLERSLRHEIDALIQTLYKVNKPIIRRISQKPGYTFLSELFVDDYIGGIPRKLIKSAFIGARERESPSLNEEIWEKVITEELKDYWGKYVAIAKGEIVDSDFDLQALSQRVFKNFDFGTYRMTNIGIPKELIRVGL